MTSQLQKPNISKIGIENSSIKEKNYQLNMDLLSSIKSIPGKIVNLQTENLINEDLNKKLIYPEGKHTTSSSISKDYFYEQNMINSEEKINKKLNTTNSVFRPMLYFPIKRSTLNYYPTNSMMSFTDILLQNQIQQNPYKITNSSFSKNSFSPNIPIYEPNNLIINPMNTLTQLNQINIFNPINYYNNNFNKINNTFNPNFNLTNINNENNLFLNQKRNFETSEKKEKIKHKKRNIIFYTNFNNIEKQIINKEKEEKKNLFTVIPKSVYNYKKRKPRKKKLFTGIKNKLKCHHDGCEGIFKTKKQLKFHHYKMNPNCHNDTLTLIKLISGVKNILLKNKNIEEYKQKFGEIYRETMKNISLEEHIETLIGFNFEDLTNE